MQIESNLKFNTRNNKIISVNYNTFCFATIDKVFYLVASVLTTCFGP
jgi:hypothetical protein